MPLRLRSSSRTEPTRADQGFVRLKDVLPVGVRGAQACRRRRVTIPLRPAARLRPLEHFGQT